jgi:predicted acylesterase/phospholipase RssA
LVASSAIPGIFPWRLATLAGAEIVLVDGGVVAELPLATLVEHGCGTIYACAVGPVGPIPPPTNGLQNVLQSMQTMKHQCTKLEEEYVRLKLSDQGSVNHVHPVVDFPVSDFDFTPELIHQILDDACAKTVAWLSEPHAE